MRYGYFDTQEPAMRDIQALEGTQGRRYSKGIDRCRRDIGWNMPERDYPIRPVSVYQESSLKARTVTLMAACVLAILLAALAIHAAQMLPSAFQSPEALAQNPIIDAVIDKDKSTPKASWAKGSMPYLYQTDPEWADSEYGGSNIKESGCGPTCAAMVYIFLTGKKDMNPAKMGRMSQAGGYLEGDLTRWAFFYDGLQQKGIDCMEITPRESIVRGQLLLGRPIICSVTKGDFTSKGHFIVLYKVNEDGTIEVRDPNSYDRSHQNWELGRILGQCANLWSCRLA